MESLPPDRAPKVVATPEGTPEDARFHASVVGAVVFAATIVHSNPWSVRSEITREHAAAIVSAALSAAGPSVKVVERLLLVREAALQPPDEDTGQLYTTLADAFDKAFEDVPAKERLTVASQSRHVLDAALRHLPTDGAETTLWELARIGGPLARRARKKSG